MRRCLQSNNFISYFWLLKLLPVPCVCLHNICKKALFDFDFFGTSWHFWVLHPINTLTYLLTAEFLVDNIYGSFVESHVRTTRCELKVLECHKDTQMKAHNITKLTAELKSSDNIQYRNKIYYSVGGFGGRGFRCNLGHSNYNVRRYGKILFTPFWSWLSTESCEIHPEIT